MSVRFDNTSEFLFDNMSSYLIIGVFLLIIRVRLGLMGTKRGRDPKTRSSIVMTVIENILRVLKTSRRNRIIH